jgi:hypothetical protein
VNKKLKVTYGVRVDKSSVFNAKYESADINPDGTFAGTYTTGTPTIANNDPLVIFDANGNPITNGVGKDLDNTKLPKGTLAILLKTENKRKLAAVLTYHVVAGNLDSKAIIAAIKKGNGAATLTTVQGGKLVGKIVGKDVVLTDEKGTNAKVTAVDITSSNGVIHVINKVVLSK